MIKIFGREFSKLDLLAGIGGIIVFDIMAMRAITYIILNEKITNIQIEITSIIISFIILSIVIYSNGEKIHKK